MKDDGIKKLLDGIIESKVDPSVESEWNDDGLFFAPRPPGECMHYGSFKVDANGGTCTCSMCGSNVSPMFVLQRLMKEESKWNTARYAYQKAMKRLKEREKTKCHHCGKMTRISRK